ncbi:hypothetical protein L226DRAFT_489397 [Lentinus tigrinus ALCF2SS1-7]|uniref:Fungal-type protein kinase domain-containing protein n=1 Tax=Lentinus tigrinus ALCF2SS1-6 TaxID=1328759 RepID=A0A5C2S7B5_9APHY|nr:hypothetical protein L227DRAFT_613839 [Lentinus tigrinus ALCF2SS1-6]RPD73118.1 hypothetical protein L226DRAFT_489397 [Lentinus tigrinus ALCF2SS1-7]
MADNESPTNSAENIAFHIFGDSASTAAPLPPSSPNQLHLEGGPTASTTSFSPLAAGDPAPAPSAAAPIEDAPKNAVDPYIFYNTPIKDGPNAHAYNPATDKQRGPWLVDRNGMGPRFRELPIDQFLEGVANTGPKKKARPTDDERKRFTVVDLSEVKVDRLKEKDWYPYINETANSVFDAINDTQVVWLDTSTHKAQEHVLKGENKSRTGTYNDAGVYWNNMAARAATTLTEQQKEASKFTDEEMQARGKVGGRSWHWIAIPVEIKGTPERSAFIFHDPDLEQKKRRPASSKIAQPTRSKGKRSQGSNPSSSHLPGRIHPEVVPIDASESGPSPKDGDPPGARAEHDPIKRLITDSKEGEAALAQFAEYILNVLNHQHRLFCYAIYVMRRMARLCYIDRGAIVISTEFDWVATDSALHDFLWMVGHMSPEELGYDPTAELIEETLEGKDSNGNDSEAEPFRRMATNSDVPEAIQKYVLTATAPGVPIYKIRITPMAAPDDEKLPEDPSSQPKKSAASPPPNPSSASPSPPPTKPTDRYFLVGKPHFVTDSLVGRCTRGYVAYDLSTGNLCFIKDYWRPYVPGRSRPEHLVYERLQSSKVENVATLICGGDVGGLRAQRTQLHKFLHHMKAPPVPRIHYRLGTEEIGLPLEDFKNFRELLFILYFALLAHRDAWEKAKILHRDISVGNILIHPRTKRGILIDWDQCRLQCELAHGPTEPDRTGTWPFRSALSLAYPRKPPRLSDDLESFIHVFRYLVLKYHFTLTRSLKVFVTDLFESATWVRGIKVGGETKMLEFLSLASPIAVRNNTVLQAVLDAIHKGCYDSYKQIDRNAMQDRYGIDEPEMEAVPLEDDGENVGPLPGGNPNAEADGGEHHGGDDAAHDSAHGHGDASSTTTRMEPTDSEVPDLCDVSGFLSQHNHLLGVIWDKFRIAKPLSDKQENQFKFRSEVLHQDVYQPTPRTSRRGISDMSMSSGTNLVPSNLSGSPFSSELSTTGLICLNEGKRARDEDEEESGDVEMADASNEDSYTDEEEGDPDGIREQKRKRPRL